MGLRTSAIAAATAGLVVVGFTGAPALAYPPGTKSEVFTNKARFKPGQAIKAEAVQVKPGCKVTFKWTGKNNNFKRTRSAKANKNGVARAKLPTGPKKPGRYKVRITVGGNGCRPATAVSSFRVGGSGRG